MILSIKILKFAQNCIFETRFQCKCIYTQIVFSKHDFSAKCIIIEIVYVQNLKFERGYYFGKITLLVFKVYPIRVISPLSFNWVLFVS